MVIDGGPIFLVGDGSGSTISGEGHMLVDWLTIDTAPVPEPPTLILAGPLLAAFCTMCSRMRGAPSRITAD